MRKYFPSIGASLDLIASVGYIVLYFLNYHVDQAPKAWMSKSLPLLVYITPVIILVSSLFTITKFKNFLDFFRTKVHLFITLPAFFIVWGDFEFTFWLVIFHAIASIIFRYIQNKESNEDEKLQYQVGLLEKIKLNPAQLVILTFMGLILFGAMLISLPFAHQEGFELSYIDAFFMSTSAACVTGLAPFAIGENFTLIGQVFMLFLIQVGGLGIMTLTTSMTILLGKSFGMKEQVLMKGILDISSFEELIDMIIEIIKLTLFIELWGAILLTAAFVYEGQDLGEAMFNGLFHSVSAFCNAGFALFSDSLVQYKTNYFVNTVIMVLILLGGLGFFVMKDIKVNFYKKKKFKNFTLHSKIVLYTNVALVLVGSFSFFFSEFLNTLDAYSLIDKVVISIFQSVTTRTAGFNTIEFSNLHMHTIYFMCILMFIGASPGSTGGGLKTTTFAILIQSVKATLQGRSEIEFFNRRIPNSLYVRSVALFIIAMSIFTVFFIILLKVEPNLAFGSLFFETVSAFGTVGLSLGITSEFSPIGKFFIILLMFIGRVGPLTLVLAFNQMKTLPSKVQYSEGRVMIG